MELILRAIVDADLEMILGWRTDPGVSDYMYTDFVPSLEQQRRWFAAICRDSSRMDWVIQLEGVDVGLFSIVSIDQINRRCDWAYYLASPAVRGRGVGGALELNVLCYVFEVLGMNKLCCEVLATNERVVALHQRYGSKVEGVRRAHVHKRGEFFDVVEMGILREDWEHGVRAAHSYDRATFARPTKHT